MKRRIWFDDKTILEAARDAWTQPDRRRSEGMKPVLQLVGILGLMLWLWIFFSHVFRGMP